MEFSKKKFVVAEHNSDDVGPGVVLVQYLNKKSSESVYHLYHPNLYIKRGYSRSSNLVTYKHGKKVEHKKAFFFRLPEIALYIKDFFYTLWWIGIHGEKIDVFVGMGDLNAITGIVLKYMGKVDKVVYYVIDYIPERFNNCIINSIYHWVEQFSAQHADVTWNLSPRMIQAREHKWKRKFPHQYILPHGLVFDKKKIIPFSKIHKRELMYMGHLNKGQGISLILESLPEIRKKIPDIQFTLIGTGNDEAELKTMVYKLQLENTVHFLGSIPDNEEMERRLSMGALGVALYQPGNGYSYYSDPGKIKHYLSVGLPIVMTGIPAVAEDIKKRHCGVIIPYEKKACIQAIIKYFSENSMKLFKTNAIEFAQQFDWDVLFNNAFSYENLQ